MFGKNAASSTKWIVADHTRNDQPQFRMFTRKDWAVEAYEQNLNTPWWDVGGTLTLLEIGEYSCSTIRQDTYHTAPNAGNF